MESLGRDMKRCSGELHSSAVSWTLQPAVIYRISNLVNVHGLCMSSVFLWRKCTGEYPWKSMVLCRTSTFRSLIYRLPNWWCGSIKYTECNVCKLHTHTTEYTTYKHTVTTIVSWNPIDNRDATKKLESPLKYNLSDNTFVIFPIDKLTSFKNNTHTLTTTSSTGHVT